MRLGWRWSRANDFQEPDLRPLRDSFSELQRFMTWPYAAATVSGTAGTDFSIDRTLTVTNAPLGLATHNLVRNNTIQVPRDFDSWLVVGGVCAVLDNVGVGSYTLGWKVNGTQTNWRLSEHTDLITDVRILAPIFKPVKKGDTLSIGATTPGAGSFVTDDPCEVFVFFLPLI